jgi:hypothetical protein
MRKRRRQMRETKRRKENKERNAALQGRNAEKKKSTGTSYGLERKKKEKKEKKIKALGPN